MNSRHISSGDDMQQLGQELAESLSAGNVVFLQGDLGAGKTTLVRGILSGFGFQGHVKSPTYAIVEPYQINNQKVYHFDLYRLNTPQELCDMGFDDYLTQDAIILVEWPEKASLLIPQANLTCVISFEPKGGRQVSLVWAKD